MMTDRLFFAQRSRPGLAYSNGASSNGRNAPLALSNSIKRRNGKWAGAILVILRYGRICSFEYSLHAAGTSFIQTWTQTKRPSGERDGTSPTKGSSRTTSLGN